MPEGLTPQKLKEPIFDSDIPPNYAIELQVVTIDTRVGEPALPNELRIAGYQAHENGYYIVQFVDVILPDWRDQLDATGAVRLGYLPNNAFIVKMTEAQRTLVTGLDVVQWIGIYQPAYKIAPQLSVPSVGVSTLTVLTFLGSDLESIKGQLQQWGGTIESTSENEFLGKMRVSIDLQFLVAIANLNDVMWIEPWVEPELSTN